jgi:hypothetical protein
MPSSLENLVNNLSHDDFYYIKNHFPNQNLQNKVLRKLIFPYDFLKSKESLKYSKLPDKNEFFNQLSESHIAQDEYEFIQEIWELFGCKNLGDLLELYCLIDVLSLSDVWRKFSILTYNAYGLNINHYLSTPALSWDAMLKQTSIQLEYIRDPEKIAFLNDSIRGGICQVNEHLSTANNKFIKNYDSKQQSSYIISADFNNLYGFAMQQKLPFADFKFIKSKNQKLEIFENLINGKLDENSEKGYIFEINAVVNETDHQYFDEYPFMPQKKTPPNSTQKKLILDLEPKENYKIYYLNLKQMIEKNIKITKISRILEFSQSHFLSNYIQLNTNMRSSASNEFEKDFFKLMNNSIYGKN